MKKVVYIKTFILTAKPRRCELNKFIIENIIHRVYNSSKDRGVYGNNIATWLRYKYIKIVNRRFIVTPLGKKYDNWYSEQDKVKIKRLEELNEYLRAQCIKYKYTLNTIRQTVNSINR